MIYSVYASPSIYVKINKSSFCDKISIILRLKGSFQAGALVDPDSVTLTPSFIN